MARITPAAYLSEDEDRILSEDGSVMRQEDAGAGSGRELPTPPRIVSEAGELLLQEGGSGNYLTEGVTSAAAESVNFLNDLKMPKRFSRGTGGPQNKTWYHEWRDGGVLRNSQWSRQPVRWDVADQTQDAADTAALLNFYRAARGTLNGFRFQDPTDWSTHPDGIGAPTHSDKTHRMLLGFWDQTDPGPYQLVKRYRLGGIEIIRPITRPMLAGDEDRLFHLYVDGVLLTEGTDYTVSFDGGEVVIVAAGSSYAQGAEVEWSGTFDVPVQFAIELDENLRSAFETETIQGVDSLPVEEVRENVWFSDHRYKGGYQLVTMSSDSRSHQIDASAGMFAEIVPDVSGRISYMPTADYFQSGGPVMWVMNGAASGSGRNLEVRDFAGNTKVTALPPQEIAEFCLRSTSWGSKPEWVPVS